MRLLISLLWVSLLTVGAHAETSGLAGWAELNITPPLGIALGGRGDLEEAASTIADSLRGQVTILRDARTEPVVLISLDLIGLPVWFTRQTTVEITACTGIPAERIIFNCSHTHSGPLTFRELFAGVDRDHGEEKVYLLETADEIVDLVTKTLAQLRPVAARVYSGICHAGINRRWEAPTGEVLMAPNPSAPRDSTVWILQLEALDQSAEALLFSYACHPIIMRDIARTSLSADFPGAVRTALRAERGESVHVQFFQGAAGDLRQRPQGDLKKRIFPKAIPADLQRMTTDLTRAIIRALDGPGEALVFELAARREDVRLPRGTPPSAEHFQKMTRGVDSSAARSARYWLAQLARGGLAHEADEWVVGLLRLSPTHWITYFSGEPVFEWDAQVRRLFGGASVDLWGYCQAATGYLPVDQILCEGGYEVRHSNHLRAWNPAPFAAGVDDSVGRSIAAQLNAIRSADTAR